MNTFGIIKKNMIRGDILGIGKNFYMQIFTD